MTKRHEHTRDHAKTLRQTMTAPEQRLWQALRGGRIGVKFQRQVVIAPYIADFAARSERLVIEIDGATHADSADRDATRTANLAAQGYRVIRFTNEDVMRNLDGVLQTILMALGRTP
jgi:very-short-patch-repair endonuclease